VHHLAGKKKLLGISVKGFSSGLK